MLARIKQWLETRASSPAYSGLVLLLIAIAFFGAATNTMVGWLYALSGIIFALLGVAAILPPRALKALQLRRSSIEPVSAGQNLTLELIIENPTQQSKTLLQVIDQLPTGLKASSHPPSQAIEKIPPKGTYRWIYTILAPQRGIYRWSQVDFKTATPLGLFWSSRSRYVPAKAVVYPWVFPLKQCPILDTIGEQESDQLPQDQRFQTATMGITRGLRPYRRGDSPRLIHWRSSARYGELRVREMEISIGGQEVVIALNNAIAWEADQFEDAVVAAASLYFYAVKAQLHAKLWTAQTGLIQTQQGVLETLAAVQFQQNREQAPPALPVIWLTCQGHELRDLPHGSRWIYFSQNDSSRLPDSEFPGLMIKGSQPLQPQLQQLLGRH